MIKLVEILNEIEIKPDPRKPSDLKIGEIYDIHAGEMKVINKTIPLKRWLLRFKLETIKPTGPNKDYEYFFIHENAEPGDEWDENNIKYFTVSKKEIIQSLKNKEIRISRNDN